MGKPSERHELTLADGDKETVTLGPAAPPPPPPLPPAPIVEIDRGRRQRLLAYTLGASGVVLVGASVAVTLVAKSNVEASDHPDDWHSGQITARYGGTSLFVAGGAAIALGVYLYVRAPGIERVTPAVSPNSVGVSVHGAF